MSYNQEKVESITVRITPRQRKMLDEMTQEWGATDSGGVRRKRNLSDVVRDILDRELKRLERAALSMAPTRRS